MTSFNEYLNQVKQQYGARSIPLANGSGLNNELRTRVHSDDFPNVDFNGIKGSLWRGKHMLDRIEKEALKLPIDPENFSVTVHLCETPIKMYLRQSPNGRCFWYQDMVGHAALSTILNHTITRGPADFFGAHTVKGGLERSYNFAAKKLPPKEHFEELWKTITGLAAPQYIEKFGEPHDVRFRRTLELGAKPADWPASEAVQIEIDGHKLNLLYSLVATDEKTDFQGTSFHQGWQLSADSMNEFVSLFSERQQLKAASYLTFNQIAEELGINKRRNQSQGKWRESTTRDYYKDLERIFVQLQQLADGLTTDGETASIKVSQRDQTFQMQKPEGSKKWLLSRDSLPSIRALLGLSPDGKYSAATAASTSSAWGITPSSGHTDHASRKIGWPDRY